MLSPPPLRRASLPLITSYLPANHLTPLLVDAGEGGSAAPHLDGAAREGQPFAQQSENAGSSGSLFDYGDVMGTAVKVDAQHYLHTGHQGGALSYQLSSYPQQHSSILPSSHLAQYSRFSYLPPSSGLTAAPSDGNPASYLTFGAAAAGGVMTYTAGGHTYFQSQSGNPILLQTGVQAYQPCPWGDVYGQPGQYPSAVYHRPQYPGLGRDVSLHPPGAALGLLPAQHCIPLQRAPGPPTATVFATSQRPAVGAASAFQTPDSSALRPQYENPERAEQTESGEAEAAQDLAPAGGKLGYEPEAESARNPLPESRSAESDGAFDCDFSPIQF
ncbi:homeobox protein NOBOX-like [Scleropages formosus]|uniref:homeobox protein NOBOX-like n=1 Tax=Scleropages formosus TaxID=113540 RepID=UPI0010FABD2E|nr:homeobox protein NOBOX-like [Scleropages formosus]